MAVSGVVGGEALVSVAAVLLPPLPAGGAGSGAARNLRCPPLLNIPSRFDPQTRHSCGTGRQHAASTEGDGEDASSSK